MIRVGQLKDGVGKLGFILGELEINGIGRTEMLLNLSLTKRIEDRIAFPSILLNGRVCLPPPSNENNKAHRFVLRYR